MRLGFFKTPFFYKDVLRPSGLVYFLFIFIEEVVRLDGLLPDCVKKCYFLLKGLRPRV